MKGRHWALAGKSNSVCIVIPRTAVDIDTRSHILFISSYTVFYSEWFVYIYLVLFKTFKVSSVTDSENTLQYQIFKHLNISKQILSSFTVV